MKYLIILFLLTLVSCVSLQSRKSLQKFYCARDLIELKVDSARTFEFCHKTFRDEIGD